MPEITEQEFLRRLDTLDEETLLFLSKYATERRKVTRVQAWVSALIASVAGFALTVGYFFPESNKLVVAAVSTVVGSAIGFFGIWERRNEERRLIETLLRDSFLEPSRSPTAERKRELIEELLKAEGL